MCLILFAWKAHPNYPLIVCANRDESYSRPSRQAQFWPEQPQLLGGKDMEAGGTWLGITKGGRFAAITNYRDFNNPETGTLSRGHLVKDYLLSEQSPADYMQSLATKAKQYHGFNLLVGDQHDLYYYSNRSDETIKIEPGVHGLSNHLFNTPWPKVSIGKQDLSQCLSQEINEKNLMPVLLNKTQPSDEKLPDTGVGLEAERFLSTGFIASENYGTRASTLLWIDSANNVIFVEQNYGPHGAKEEKVAHQFCIY